MTKELKVINTQKAPQAIGPYSQAVQAGDTVYVSGQIPLDPETMEVVDGGIAAQTHQVFKNLGAVLEEAGVSYARCVKLTIYLVDLAVFAEVNEIMKSYFSAPYPARATIQISQLPKGSLVEVDAVAVH